MRRMLMGIAAVFAALSVQSFAAIYVNHVGYLSKENKRCIVTSTTTSIFDLINESSQSVFSGSLISANSDLGTYKTGDFSSFTQSGSYRVKVGSTYSRLFSIGSSVVTQYQDFLQMIGTNYFKKQRCGNTTVGWSGQACHLDDGIRTDNSQHYDVVGGWHDACDLRKWIGETLLGMYSLEVIKERHPPSWDAGNVILDELKWGNIYFHKMLDPSGKVYSYCGGDDGNRWTDNTVGNTDDRPLHVKGAWANQHFRFVGAQARLYNLYKTVDPTYAATCLSLATLAYNYCLSHFKFTDYVECGTGIEADIQMYLATKKKTYLAHAVTMADNLMALQETTYRGGQTTIKGFFYRAPDKVESVQDHQVRQIPLIALADLCELQPAHAKVGLWKEALRSYCEDYLMVISSKNAFGLLPYGVYTKNPGGTRSLGSIWYRYFFYKKGWFVGTNATILGDAVILMKSSKVLNKPEYFSVAMRQLDWVLGCNPYDASRAEGLGSNQPTLFVTSEFSPQTPHIKGGVMNGVGGTSGDAPDLLPGSWQTCEYWTPNTCYLGWALSELLAHYTTTATPRSKSLP